MSGQYFISYSRIDGEIIAVKLTDQLAAGPPSIDVWLDQRRLQPSADWDEQLVKALSACDGFLYVMTKDSVSPRSECKREWTRALKYKKPIIPLLFDREAEVPFRLEPIHRLHAQLRARPRPAPRARAMAGDTGGRAAYTRGAARGCTA